MAVLQDADRRELWALFMQELTRDDPISITKTELRAAVDALDDFFEANKTAINNAIPQPARGSLSAAQKAKLAMFVIRARWVKGS